MRKLLLAIAAFLSLSISSQAEEVYITNNSDYDVAVRASSDWGLSIHKWSLVPSKGTAILEIDDENPTSFLMYRLNLKAALKNTVYVTTKIAKAKALTLSNAVFWIPAAALFLKTCYNGMPITKQTIDPKNNDEKSIKNIVIQNYKHNNSTIESKIEEADFLSVFAECNNKFSFLVENHFDFFQKNQEYMERFGKIISSQIVDWNSYRELTQLIKEMSKAVESEVVSEELVEVEVNTHDQKELITETEDFEEDDWVIVNNTNTGDKNNNIEN